MKRNKKKLSLSDLEIKCMNVGRLNEDEIKLFNGGSCWIVLKGILDGIKGNTDLYIFGGCACNDRLN